MKIGLLSDTHGYLDPQLFSFFEPCEEVWHAGDIGSTAVVEELAAFRPLRAVHGNIDDREVRLLCPEDLHFTCGGLSVWLTHIGGKPASYDRRVRRRLEESPPDIFVCGHTHILRVTRTAQLLYLNPGAAGKYGIHHTRTALRFEVVDGKVQAMEVIELQPRW